MNMIGAFAVGVAGGVAASLAYAFLPADPGGGLVLFSWAAAFPVFAAGTALAAFARSRAGTARTASSPRAFLGSFALFSLGVLGGDLLFALYFAFGLSSMSPSF